MKAITTSNNEKNYSSFIHLSLLTKYFIPFGNYLIPIILWGSKKNQSEFIDHNGKQALNFQLSMFLYSITMLIISIPTLLVTLFSNFTINEIERGEFILEHLSSSNLTGFAIFAIITVFLLCILKCVEFFIIIYAAVKSNNGEYYEYPMTIKFIK